MQSTAVQTGPTPEAILELGLGFWKSKTLLSAVELGVFTALTSGPKDAATLSAELGLHSRSAHDFLDALVSMDMLERHDGRYSNTPATGLFLNRDHPAYMGGLLEMANHRLYGFWGSLTEALRTGLPQNESKLGGDVFAELYSSPDRLRQFLGAMTGLSTGTARAIAARFPWDRYRSFVDVGCAQGALPVHISLEHSHLTGGGYDLPVVGPIFEEFVAKFGLSGRVQFHAGDFFKDPMPRTDVILMGHILHDWDLPTKKMLIAKAYEALPEGGALVVFDAMIDDERRTHTLGLLMSLNMLIETPGGFDYTGASCTEWMKEAGFRDVRVEHLLGPDSMAIATK